MRLRRGWSWGWALCGLLATGTGQAQNVCPQPSELQAQQLIGRWDVELHTQPPTRWSLELRPHPEHEGSLQGTLAQAGQQALVVADWDDSEFTMEESQDGQRIAATWLGTASDGQCGRQLEGTRHSGDPATTRPVRFTMRSSRLR